MPETCGHLIGGDPGRPCVMRPEHADPHHRDAEFVDRRREYNREYHRAGRRGPRDRRAYREANKDRIRECGLEYYRKNQDRIRAKARRSYNDTQYARRLRRVYGLESAEYAVIKKSQGGKCAICARATGRTRRLSVDHCHKTRVIRGLLCGPCNRVLGHMRDDPAALQRAIDYLGDPPARRALGRIALVPENSPAQQPRKRKSRPKKPPTNPKET